MILQALKEYYDRKAADPESGIAPAGFEWKAISFVIVLNPDGMPVSLNPTYEGEGKNRRAKLFLVPQAVEKTSGIAANLLWDNLEYVLGIVQKGKPERVERQHAAFKKRIEDLGDISDSGLLAVKRFLERKNKEELLQCFTDSWRLLLQDRGNLTFQLSGDTCLIMDRQDVKSAIQKMYTTGDEGKRGICLVTGKKERIEQLHTAIKGVYGAQKSGAKIVSFNLDAFKFFGKTQGANAPVGRASAFRYTTALNHLLSKDSKQRMQVGEASTVFWAEKENDLERQFADFFGEPPRDDPDRGVRAVESLFRSIVNGVLITDENKNNRFYVLGLSPNSSRIAIRFWIVGTIPEMGIRIYQHFKDTEIIRPKNSKNYWQKWQSLNAFLAAAANETKYDTNKPNLVYYRGRYFDVKPNLAGDTIRSILEGLPYPETLLQTTIRRVLAEREITYGRAALIKACINRSTRFKNPNIKEELKMSLDEGNTNIGYRLGRLFAALEKIQQEANPGLNATIRDRYYGAASGTPSTVFGNLMRLKNHHLSKLENVGRRIFFEKLLGEIIEGIEAKIAFPTHLNLEDQGRFAIGYYHQMQKFFTKKTDNNDLIND